MNKIIVYTMLLLATSSVAFAAEKKPPECLTLDALKAKNEKTVKAMQALAEIQGTKAPEVILPDTFTKVSISAYHFLEGAYADNPYTPQGLPPGDGALLATAKGQDGGQVLWTKKDLVCGSMAVAKTLLAALRGVKDDDKDELHL
jgi:hypothetical protein